MLCVSRRVCVPSVVFGCGSFIHAVVGVTTRSPSIFTYLGRRYRGSSIFLHLRGFGSALRYLFVFLSFFGFEFVCFATRLILFGFVSLFFVRKKHIA